MPIRKLSHPAWLEVLKAARPGIDWSQVGHVLCLDPGETTGWALFEDGWLESVGQEPTGTEPALTADFVRRMHEEVDLRHIVYEEYRIRGNKAKQHVGSEVVTIQHIGVIRATADQLGIPATKQAAGLAKGFADDRKLRMWGLYNTGQRHANDAVRHGVYWHLFAAGRTK